MNGKRVFGIVMAAIAVILVGLAGVTADVLHLASGQTLEGKVIIETEEEVTLEIPGGKVTIPRQAIERIERGKSPLEIYAEKLAAATTSADFAALVEWCVAHSLDTTEVEGRLRDARAAERRSANPETYCRNCQAYGDQTCIDCEGAGKVPMPCKTCAKTGSMPCQLCDGKGAVPCGRCRKTGKLTIPCSRCDGTGTANCSRCDGTGKIKPQRRTRRLGDGEADGPKWITCPKCDNRARQKSFPCSSCNATGKITVTCPSCSGKATLRCLRCGDSGKQICEICRGRTEVQATCVLCDGAGRVMCEACSGTGITPEERDSIESGR